MSRSKSLKKLINRTQAIEATPSNGFENVCEQIGTSRDGRPLFGYRYGHGTSHISLLAGCHADEPAGPILLKKLVNYLSRNQPDELAEKYTFHIIPHANPDGEVINQSWYEATDEHADIASYLRHAVRELPGDDVEFGFPGKEHDALRPENKYIYEFWKSSDCIFDLHVSLHGMMRSWGAWFLIDEGWMDRTEFLQETCIHQTDALGYTLHDIDRKGEKGFTRIAKGFCTRPDSKYMRAHFESKNDHEMASKFHHSSMESVLSLGGDPLTLVSEMPLFILPDQSEDISWPNKLWNQQGEVINGVKNKLLQGAMSDNACRQTLINDFGLTPMPFAHQRMLQWTLICAGICQVAQ